MSLNALLASAAEGAAIVAGGLAAHAEGVEPGP